MLKLGGGLTQGSGVRRSEVHRARGLDVLRQRIVRELTCSRRLVMRGKNVLRGISLITVLCLASCASYDPVVKGLPATLDPSGPNVAKAEGGDLTLYVEEYATPEKSQAAFDTKMTDEGVLPLLIRVESRAQQDYEVKASQVVLRGQTPMKSLTPEEAAGKAERSAVGRALGWSLIVPIISIPIAIAASATHTSKINTQIAQDFSAKAFADGTIAPNKERGGFVFFEFEKGRKDLSGLSLEVTARNLATNEDLIIAAPLPAATFTPRREATEKPAGEHRW